MITTYINTNIRCQECSLGSYSLIDGMIAEKCERCPVESTLCYRDKIFLKPGI